MITIEQLKEYAVCTNIDNKVKGLRSIHWEYAKNLLSAMVEDTEEAMNDAWSEMPRNQKPSLDDKKARIIPELIVRFISSKQRNKS
jgi:hypothetical protein